MKYKTELFILTTSLIVSAFVWHAAYAQQPVRITPEFSPIGELAQDYIERLNDELGTAGEIVPSSNPVVVNPDAIAKEAITESIDTIAKTIEEVKKEKENVINQIKEMVKQDIDSSIVEIRKTTDKQAFELQKAVDEERTRLFEYVTQTIEQARPAEVSSFAELQTEIDASLTGIETSLETESGQQVSFDRSRRNVREALIRFQEVLSEKGAIIESRQGALVFEDADADGISDYDEIYVYQTNPDLAQTTGVDGKTDGEKIAEGINPLSESEEQISYQDPREDHESFVSSSYKVEKVELIKKDDTNPTEKLVFEGTALPNSYVTLYIYSTPIVVTVKTDQSGQWTYELEKELENGEHQMYVATVDSSGKIVARSNPILFTKSAEAATIGIAGSLNGSITTQNFLKDNFILITLAVLIAVVVLGMMFVGNHKNIRSAVADLKNEVNPKA